LYPSVTDGGIARNPEDLGQWWDALTRNRANLMTVHLTSTVRIGEDRTRTGCNSFGGIWDYSNLYVNDASLLPDAPGVNPQGTIMAIAARNCDHFLSHAG
jgi:choline dehydrogenase-like flavoprotein